MYHQMGTKAGMSNAGNKKFVSPDGSEAVYDFRGRLVTDPVNQGTYNYINPGDLTESAGHFIVDMVPYFFLGNSRDDPTWMHERVFASYDGDTGTFYEKESSNSEKNNCK